MLYFRYPSYTIDCYKLTTKYIYIQNHMFVFLQSKLKYFPRIFIYEQGVLFVKLSFVNIMVRKIICSEISAITVPGEWRWALDTERKTLDGLLI